MLYEDIDSTSGKRAIEKFAATRPVFACVISYTETSEIPGLTVAGADPGLIRYTSPADAEFLYYGSCRCIDSVPATPDGKPTPALITRTALQSADIPAFIVDAGARVKPSIPFVSFGLDPGRNISKEDAMGAGTFRQALSFGELAGSQLARMSDLVVIGESIPGGTTTALATLTALGVNARFRVSSSMPDNPHDLKNQVIETALARKGMKPGAAIATAAGAFDAVASFGDPMMPSVAGIAKGALEAGCRVILAGGTQMTAVALLLRLTEVPLSGLAIGTTSYVMNDRTADLAGLAREASPDIPVFSCDLHMGESAKPGLRAFSQGFVKEGVGAGGASIAAMLKSDRITGYKLMRAAEKEYEASIESRKGYK